MRVASVVGARPQFIKAAPMSGALRKRGHQEQLIHTGQHYDREMSRIFFEEMGIPEPSINLGVGSGSHGEQTGRMLAGIEEVLLEDRPDWVLVFGDTNSTLAGALAACKLGVPVAHVEAGLRSFNRSMPEEHNRVLTDHCSDLLLCPTDTAVRNLAAEGVRRGVRQVGDIMFDAAHHFVQKAEDSSTILEALKLAKGEYFLATVHRAYNTDSDDNLVRILESLSRLEQDVVFPVHPRTRKRLEGLLAAGRIRGPAAVRLLEPVGYLDMLMLERNARAILTDSGGVQKEAYFFAAPCVTLRPETEWLETLEGGWNVVAGTDPDTIVEAARRPVPELPPPPVFGSGDSAERIADAMEQWAPDAAPLTH